MTKEEADLIIVEQNKSKEEILKAVAKVKSDYHELCKLKNMRIAELEEELKDANEKVVHLACNQNKDLKRKLTKAKEQIQNLIKTFVGDLVRSPIYFDKEQLKAIKEAEQFLNSEVEK